MYELSRQERAESLDIMDAPSPSTGRKSMLKFPPKGSGLVIPKTLFCTTRQNILLSPVNTALPEPGLGSDATPESEAEQDMRYPHGSTNTVLQAQVDEMIRLMRRSVVLHEQGESGRGAVGDGDVNAAEERVSYVQVDEGENTVVGDWLREMMG